MGDKMPNYVEVISRVLSEVITKEDDRIPAADLFDKVSKELDPPLDINEFRTELKRILDEELGGKYHSVKGRYGGVRLASGGGGKKEVAEEVIDDSTVAEDEVSEEEFKEVSLVINDELRIHATDSRNWTIQQKVGNVWLSRAYYSTLENALKSCAKKLVDKKLRGGVSVGLKLNDFSNLINQIELSILNELRTMQKE